MPRMIETFGALCADAAQVGARIALEIMPFTNIKTVEQGLEIVQGAGAKNGGLLLDIWHIARGKIPYDRLKTIPKDCIAWIEIDDADAEPKGDLFEDTLFRRKLCGEGALNVPAFLQAIKATGYDDAYGVEVISEIHRKKPLDEMATRSFDTAIKQFDLVK
jgi:sugar phosphate isomerase/epimerase